ncbi:MAG: cytochrome c biogenesis protein [Deltaproteobacteria bacterium]|nr:cytochrome c biogenesis protein [Deltaproteobacteria bacterium]
MKALLYIAAALYAAAFFANLAAVLKKQSGADAVSFSRASLWALIAALVVHAAYIGWRGYYGERFPVASIGETLSVYSFSVAFLTLVVWRRYSERITALITLPVALFAIAMSILKMAPPRELPLILKTIWFELHVMTSFVAYALFTLAFAAALISLVRTLREHLGADSKDLGTVTIRSVLWGFFFFSVSMFSGAIWGFLAWGAYWLWEPKIIWSFVLWFAYAAVMHVYYVKNWKAKGVAVGALIGFVVMMFTWLGVGMLMKSSHSF